MTNATPFWFDNVVLTAGATAASLLAALTAHATNPFVPGGAQVVSLNFVADKAIRIGFSATSVDEDEGGVLGSGVYFVDSATGAGGNTIPLSQIFPYAPSGGGDATLTVYVRTIV